MRERHDRLERPAGSMLLVLEGDDHAVALRDRHGLPIEAAMDGLRRYAKRTGVALSDGTRPLRLILIRPGAGFPGRTARGSSAR